MQQEDLRNTYTCKKYICNDGSLYSTYGFREYKPLIAPEQFEVDALKKEGIISETLAQIRLSIIIVFIKWINIAYNICLRFYWSLNQVNGDEQKLWMQRKQGEHHRATPQDRPTGCNRKTSALRTHARNMLRQFSVFYLRLLGVSTSDPSRVVWSRCPEEGGQSSETLALIRLSINFVYNYESILLLIYVCLFTGVWIKLMAMNRSSECRENREKITELHHRIDRQDATRRPRHYIHMQEIR